MEYQRKSKELIEFYLLEEKGISHLTMYQGTHGYIKYREHYWIATRLAKEASDKIQKGQLIKAEETLQEALNEDPYSATLYYMLAIAKSEQEEYSNAKEYLAKALRVSKPGEQPGVLIALGDIQAKEGDCQSAIESYTGALNYPMPINGTENGQAYCYYARGMANHLAGNHEDAMNDLRTAVNFTEHATKNDYQTGLERLTPSVQRRSQEIREELLEVHTKAKAALVNLNSGG